MGVDSRQPASTARNMCNRHATLKIPCKYAICCISTLRRCSAKGGGRCADYRSW